MHRFAVIFIASVLAFSVVGVAAADEATASAGKEGAFVRKLLLSESPMPQEAHEFSAELGVHKFGALEFDAGIGGEFTDGQQALTYSVAAFHPLCPVHDILELAGVGAPDAATYLTPGVLWTHNDLEVSVGVPIGLTSDANDRGFVFTISYPWHSAASRRTHEIELWTDEAVGG